MTDLLSLDSDLSLYFRFGPDWPNLAVTLTDRVEVDRWSTCRCCQSDCAQEANASAKGCQPIKFNVVVQKSKVNLLPCKIVA